MESIQDICVRSAEILLLILGIWGMVLSFLLLFFKDLIKAAGNIFNKIISLDTEITWINRYFQTDKLTYHHNILFGIALITTSIFVLIFLFFRLDLTNYTGALTWIILNSLAMLGKIAGITGIVVAIFLLFAPEKMREIENKLNVWFDTQPLVDKLNEFHTGIDTIFLKYPVFFGVAGLTASILIIVLSIISLIS